MPESAPRAPRQDTAHYPTVYAAIWTPSQERFKLAGSPELEEPLKAMGGLLPLDKFSISTSKTDQLQQRIQIRPASLLSSSANAAKVCKRRAQVSARAMQSPPLSINSQEWQAAPPLAGSISDAAEGRGRALGGRATRGITWQEYHAAGGTGTTQQDRGHGSQCPPPCRGQTSLVTENTWTDDQKVHHVPSPH